MRHWIDRWNEHKRGGMFTFCDFIMLDFWAWWTECTLWLAGPPLRFSWPAEYATNQSWMIVQDAKSRRRLIDEHADG